MRLRALRETPAYMRLFLMGWTVYFINYFGRYNYAAAMVVIGQAEGLRTDQLGLIASTLFVSYGLGQLFSGWLGDRLNPKALIAAGMLGSAGSNLLMGLAGSVGEKATPRYGGRNFILGLQIYILWFILRVRPKISLPGSRARLCGQRGRSRRKAAVFRHFSGDPPGPGTFFPANPEKREDERHESHQAQRHGGGL